MTTAESYKQVLPSAGNGRRRGEQWHGHAVADLRYEVAEKRHVQSWNTLDKKLLIMITVNNAGERH